MFLAILLISWYYSFFTHVVQISCSCLLSSPFRGCSIILGVFICSGQMVADGKVSMIGLRSLLLISDYSEEDLLYSAEQTLKHTKGATVAHRGQTALCAYSSVCDCWARTGINTKHIYMCWHTQASKHIHSDALTYTHIHHRHTHIITFTD